MPKEKCRRRFITTLSIFLLLVSTGISLSFAATPKILIYTRTVGYDHATRTVADSVVKVLGAANGFTIDTTQDPTFFTDAKLSAYKAVCFINVTGDPVLNDSQKAAFQRFIQAGNGFVGMHAAADCGYGWPWYGKLVGAWFMGHPYNIRQGKVVVVSKNHASTSFITGDTITRTDEWYFWYLNGTGKEDPSTNANLHILLKLNDASLDPLYPFHEHPFAWYQDYDGGRSWYSGFGHSPDYFKDSFVQKHLLGGILYAAGMTPIKLIQKPQAAMNTFSHPYSVSVYDVSGKCVHNATIASGKQPPGVYVVKSNFGAHSSICRVFVGR